MCTHLWQNEKHPAGTGRLVGTTSGRLMACYATTGIVPLRPTRQAEAWSMGGFPMVSSVEPRRSTLFAPRYSFAEADRLARVSRRTSRRWVTGYRYQRPDGSRASQPPVTLRDQSEAEGVSFIELVEIAAIAGLRELNWSLRRIRDIVDECMDRFSTPHPLVTEIFKTDGREVFVRRSGALVGLLGRKGQEAWDEVLAPFLTTLDYEADLAARWWPQGQGAPVVIDPDYGFGLPVVVTNRNGGLTGIRTEIIVERFQAGELAGDIAGDLDITTELAERALQFELSRSIRDDSD